MKKSEKDTIVKWAETLTDEALEKEYYKSVYDSLGSDIEKMYELGYDMRDIEERRQYEKYLGEKSHVLETLCEERGIKLWEK